jgi:ABC-type Fe3+/spermidine/putrescine transport system ATPase subunit
VTRVAIDSLVKRYDGVAVVDGASFEAIPGELTVLLGPSGAGKSVVARVLAGLETPDEGEIYIDGRVVNAVPPQGRKVGLVFQDDSLWPHLTVAENVGFGLKVQKVPKRDRRRRVGEALEKTRIDTIAGRRPDELTPLQRQRAALARALVVAPTVLVLDEPFGRLEGRGRDDFRDEVRRLVADGPATVVLLTRDPREALALADRLAILDLGRVVQVGAPADVYDRPADAFVAQFLGPANLLQGHVEGPDPKGELVVRTPIGRLIGRGPDGAPAPPGGSPVTVAIRPEPLAIGPTTAGADANRFSATLERQEFLGEVRRLHLRGPGDWPVTALALQGQTRSLREGQGVLVSVPPEHVLVLLARRAIGP